MERKRIEMEAKVPLLNKNETVINLTKAGKQTEKDLRQNDTYYTPAHENFIEKKPISEWLRLRQTEDEVTINYKNWSNNGKNNKISCKELEVGLDDFNGMKQIMEALDFKEIIVVDKTRNSWEYNDIVISVDEVKNLGDFIELEFKTNLFDNEEESLNYILNAIRELNINVGDQIFAGYPQLVMEKNKK